MPRDIKKGPRASTGDMRRSLRASLLQRSREVLRDKLNFRNPTQDSKSKGDLRGVYRARRSSVCGVERETNGTLPFGSNDVSPYARNEKNPRFFTGKEEPSSRSFAWRRSNKFTKKRKSIPRPRHHRKGGGFINPWESSYNGRDSWRFASMPSGAFLRKQPKPKEIEGEALAGLLLLARRPQFRHARKIVNEDKRSSVIHWIGHATMLIQIRGLTVLTDPVWSNSLGPYGPRRLVPPVCDIEELPSVIDVVLMSSSQHDHFDKHTVCRLAPRVTRWLVPLGMKELLVNAGVLEDQIEQLDWWQEVRIDQNRFTCTPSQNTSGRDHSLWCSWVLSNPYHRLFYCGGTGYRAINRSSEDPSNYDDRLERSGAVCPAFREIGHKCGPFDTAVLPIGGYQPRYMSSATQGDPLDMIFVHQDLKAKRTIAHRWGTFAEPDEGILDPVRFLERAILGSPVSEHDFTYIHHGWMHNG